MSTARENLQMGKEYAVHPHHRFDQTTVHFAHRARFKGFLFDEPDTRSVSPLVFEMIEPGSANVSAPKPGEEFRIPTAAQVWMTWENLQLRALRFAGGMSPEKVRGELQKALAVLGITRRAHMSMQRKNPSPRSTGVSLLGREVLELAERFQTLKEMKNV
jgi:hypothetical protein